MNRFSALPVLACVLTLTTLTGCPPQPNSKPDPPIVKKTEKTQTPVAKIEPKTDNGIKFPIFIEPTPLKIGEEYAVKYSTPAGRLYFDTIRYVDMGKQNDFTAQEKMRRNHTVKVFPAGSLVTLERMEAYTKGLIQVRERGEQNSRYIDPQAITWTTEEIEQRHKLLFPTDPPTP